MSPALFADGAASPGTAAAGSMPARAEAATVPPDARSQARDMAQGRPGGRP